MKGQTHGGKGSAARDVDSEAYGNNFDRIFCSKSNGEHDQEKEIDPVTSTDFGHTNWRPANGGLARPYTINDCEYILMYNLQTGKEGIFNITDDKFETKEEYGSKS
tara:strand:+ start:25 stop:342 length:318 start_codon:yes stop_codon:yes gene_type:complete